MKLPVYRFGANNMGAGVDKPRFRLGGAQPSRDPQNQGLICSLST